MLTVPGVVRKGSVINLRTREEGRCDPITATNGFPTLKRDRSSPWRPPTIRAQDLPTQRIPSENARWLPGFAQVALTSSGADLIRLKFTREV